MDKKPSFLWALAVGLLFPILQVVIDLFRFGTLDPESQPSDYLVSFLAGALIGVGLVYFLRRSESKGATRAVVIAFVLSLPFALFGLVVGGMVGAVGALLLSVSPAIFVTGVGYFLGRAFVKK